MAERKKYTFSKLSVDIVVYGLADGSASTTYELQIHHLLGSSSHSHCSLQSISHLPLPLLGSKQHSMWSKHPVKMNSSKLQQTNFYFIFKKIKNKNACFIAPLQTWDVDFSNLDAMKNTESAWK